MRYSHFFKSYINVCVGGEQVEPIYIAMKVQQIGV